MTSDCQRRIRKRERNTLKRFPIVLSVSTLREIPVDLDDNVDLLERPLSLVYTYDASISISTSISTRNLCVNRCDASISALCLRLCLCLRRPVLHVRRNDASISTSTREWNDFHSLVLMLASLRRTCKPGRRKHKHKRKERKLKNNDKLSAYNLVTHALPFSAMLESNLAPKGSPAARLRQICLLLRLRMSRYASAYRTCEHPCACACAYSYACVVRVNQA